MRTEEEEGVTTIDLEPKYVVLRNKREEFLLVLPPHLSSGQGQDEVPYHSQKRKELILFVLEERCIYDKKEKTRVFLRTRGGGGAGNYDQMFGDWYRGGQPYYWLNPQSGKITEIRVKDEEGVGVGEGDEMISEGPLPGGQENKEDETQDKGEGFGDKRPRGRPRKDTITTGTKRPTIVEEEEEDPLFVVSRVSKKRTSAGALGTPQNRQRTAVGSATSSSTSTRGPSSIAETAGRILQRRNSNNGSGKSTLVAKGTTAGLPSKRIVAAEKSIPCLYMLSDGMDKLKNRSGFKVEGAHPLLGDEFKIVSWKHSQPSQAFRKLPLRERQITGSMVSNKRRDPINENRGEVLTLRSRIKEEKRDSDLESIEDKRRSSSKAKTEVVVKTEALKSSSSNSGSSDSDSDDSSVNGESSYTSSDSSESDENDPDDGRRKTRSAKVKNEKEEEVYRPPPKYFIEAEPCRPIRKSRDGRIYFSLKAKLSPAEYYQNEDLFLNWEKFVRNESEMREYYRTVLTKISFVPTLIIFHMERKEQKLVMDRSVEMVSNGTIRLSLQGEDVTEIFMKYVHIETNTHLSCLLRNLINCHLCPGCPYFSMISCFPGGVLKEDTWYSSKCARVVFHQPSSFTNLPTPGDIYRHVDQPCYSCRDMKKRLEIERSEIYKLNEKVKAKVVVDTGKRKRGRQKQPPLVFGKYKPLPQEKMEVRQSLSDLFLGFWKELGLKEDEFPQQTVDVKVDVVTEKDFPETKPEDENLIPGLLPPLPQSIPILENIEFDENGQTKLTFSEVSLNPYETDNVHFVQPAPTLPELSKDMVESLRNLDDPEDLLKTLSRIEGVPEAPSVNNQAVGDTVESVIGDGHVVSQVQDRILESGTLEVSSQFMDTSFNEFDQYSDYQYGQITMHSSFENNPTLNAVNANTSMDDGLLQDVNLHFDLNQDGDSNGLIFPTFSLTEL